MKYGSVCSGVEAATVAWHDLGWEPQFFSEFDEFPSAVLNKHFPLHILRRLLRSAGRLHRRALLFREGKGAFRSSKTIHDDNPDEGSVKPATKVMTAGRAKKIAANSPNPPNTLKAERKNHGESGAHDEAEDRTIRNNAVRVR